MSIMIWGHRGHRQHRFPDYYGEGQAYENSIRAYEETLSVCMGLECDVIQSKEATVYLTHDTLFDGMVHYELKIHLNEKSQQILGDRYIYQLSDAEAGNLTLKNGERLPVLNEFLKRMKDYPGRILNLELKGPNTTETAIRTVERAIQAKCLMPHQIVFSGFNFPALRDLRGMAGHRFKIGAVFPSSGLPLSPMYPNWPNAPQDASYIPFRLEDNVLDREDLRHMMPDFFNLESSDVNEKSIAAIEEKYPKAQIIIWSAAEKHPSQDLSLVDLVERTVASKKIYAVMSDFPREVQNLLLQRNVAIRKP